MDPELFPDLPDDLSTLSDDALNDALARISTSIKGVHEGTVSTGDATEDDVVAAVEAAAEQHERIRAELAGRATAAQERADRIAAAAAATADDPEDDADADAGDEPTDEPTADADEPDEPAVVDEEAAVTAAARRPAAPARAPRGNPARQPATPKQTPEPNWSLIASSDLHGVPAGTELDYRTLGEVFKRRRDAMTASGGLREDVPLITIKRKYDDAHTLVPGEREGNDAKIDAAVGDQALVASGGICAPRTPYYELATFGTTARPVRDAFPRFNAERGGITFAPPPALGAVTTAVGLKTAAQDQTGGTTAAKTCQTVACPSTTTVDIDVIYHCLQFGNLQGRSWPERVQQFVDLTMQAHARTAEVNLLDSIQAASISTNGLAMGGAISTLLGQILTAAAGQRNRHRMDPNRVLRCMYPAWAIDLLVVDLIRSQFGRFDLDQSGVEALLRRYNIEPSWYIDGPTGGNQLFGAQGTTALNPFPATTRWYLFPEGSFLFLDGGVLELGLVRDSTLNLSNDYQMFGESFEELAFIGVESLAVTSDTSCGATGQTGAPVSLTCGRA